MKKLLAILLLLPTIAFAQDTSWIARAKNKAGGQIVITSVQGNCRQGQLAIYSAPPGGANLLWGCVMVMTDVHIIGSWNNGSDFAFDYEGWTVNPNLRPKGNSF